MQFKFTKDGKEEIVEQERWGWGVVYKDGSELHQFGNDGIFHQFQEIDQEKVDMFVMYKLFDSDKRIDMPVENKQIFHFYRRFILSAATSEERRVNVYCFGYKDKKTGATAYHFILPDDRIIISDKDVDVTKFNI